MSYKVEVVGIINACQALEKGMGGFGATVEHMMDNIEEERAYAKQIEKEQ